MRCTILHRDLKNTVVSLRIKPHQYLNQIALFRNIDGRASLGRFTRFYRFDILHLHQQSCFSHRLGGNNVSFSTKHRTEAFDLRLASVLYRHLLFALIWRDPHPLSPHHRAARIFTGLLQILLHIGHEVPSPGAVNRPNALAGLDHARGYETFEFSCIDPGGTSTVVIITPPPSNRRQTSSTSSPGTSGKNGDFRPYGRNSVILLCMGGRNFRRL